MSMELVRRLPYDHPYRWDGSLFGGSVLWRPDALGAPLALWLDAEDTASITLNGSTVSQWSDKSGRSNHVLNATAATQPAYLSTGWLGKPTVSFALTGQQFLFGTALNNFAANNDYFIGAVFEFFQTNNNYEMIAGWRATANTAGSANGSPVLQAIGSSNDNFGIHNTDVTTATVNVSVTTRLGKRIATVGRTGGTNGNGGSVTVTATGNSQPTYDTTASQTWASAAVSNFQIGGRQQSTTGYGDKYISEIVCCSQNLSTANRERVEGYLAWKWGLEANLPAGHPYKTTPPTR